MEHNDPFPIEGIDFVEIFAGSAKQMAYYLCNSFGFTELGYAGLETGQKQHTSHVLEQGDIRLVVSGALASHSIIARFVHKHGDGVRDIALRVPNVHAAYQIAMNRGAIHESEPQMVEDKDGVLIHAAIRTYGDTIHSFIDRKSYRGILPQYRPTGKTKGPGVGLITIDHMVGNVEFGRMNLWAHFYADIMGFTNLVHFTDSQISTEYSALMSKVMQNGTGKVKFPINEPAKGKRKSQIEEFLDFFGGAGVQHIAMETKNILWTVADLVSRGVEFLPTPAEYYTELREKFRDVPQVDIGLLAQYGILADRDEDGYLLQIFTKPVTDRPTLFFEIIERQGCRGFGLGNFKSLFEAIEREQAKRGTL